MISKPDDSVLAKVKRVSKSDRMRWLNNQIMSVNFDELPAEETLGFFNLVRQYQVALDLRDSDFTKLFQDKVRTLVSRLTDRSEEILPGCFTGDDKCLAFKLDVYHEISRRFPIVVDSLGMAGGDAYGHDVSRLLSLTGMMPRNIGVRPMHNVKQRIDHGLKNEPDDLILNMIDDFMLLLYGCLKSKSVRIEGKSQSGLPVRAYGKGYKTLVYTVACKYLDDIISLERQGDLKSICEKYDLLFSFLQGSRRSPDAAGKKRYVTSAAGNEKGLSGDELQDNHVEYNKLTKALRSKFSSMRYRFVWGGNNGLNSLANSIATSARECYGKVFEFTFKHRGIEHLRKKLNQFVYDSPDDGSFPKVDDLDIIAIDVTSFDMDYPRFWLSRKIDFFKDTPFYGCFKRIAFAPSIQGTLDKDAYPDLSQEELQDKFIINADPFEFNADDLMDSGLPSGWSWVSDAGKDMALNIYYCLVKGGLLGPHSIYQLDSFLKGELKYGVFNLGDDNAILCPKGKYEEVLSILEKFSWWKADLEPGARFIGYPIHTDGFGRYKISHDPASYVTNMLTPERGISSSFRKYWALGLIARERVYADAPIIFSFKKIIGDAWRKRYGTDLWAIIRAAADEQRVALRNSNEADDSLIQLMSSKIASSRHIDLAIRMFDDFLRDPSVLSWKYTAEDFTLAFDMKLEQLERRPHVRNCEAVLKSSGYVETDILNVDKDDFNGGVFIHSKMRIADLSIQKLLYDNLKSIL